MAKLDVEWLVIFDEIYKTGSVSRAAEQLNIGQGNASIALNKLRVYFGDKLFCRTSKGMEPTPFAHAICAEIRLVLSRLEQARSLRAAFVPKTARRTFRICMTDISEIVLLPSLLNHLRGTAPGVHIDTEKITADSARRLEDGAVDLALGFMPHLEAGFYQQSLFEQNFVCLAAQSHPRIADRMTKKEFLAEGHVSVTTSGTGHTIVEKVLRQHGIEREIVARLSSFLGVARVVARTELLVIVPRLLGEALASQEPVKLLAPPVPLPSYSVKQHWHERFHDDAANVWLRRTIATLFAKGRGSAQRRKKGEA